MTSEATGPPPQRDRGRATDLPSGEPTVGERWLCGPDSDRTPTLSVVMPTLDEEAGIAECIRRTRRAIAAIGVPTEIVVSDSSTDRTPEVAREMGAIVVEPDRDGYGYAYRYAFERARGEYIAMGDADTTYDFEELPKLYAAVAEGGADMALGSRLSGTIKEGAMPALHRYVGNPLLTTFLNAFYDTGVSDAHSGFRVFSREALDRLELRSDGMEFASEMIMDASTKGLTIHEEPITYHPREGEATLDSFRDGWRHVKFMLINAPGYLFSAPAGAMATLGLFTLALSQLERPLFGVFFGSHTAVLGSLLTIVAYEIGSLAVFSAMVGDPIRRPSDPVTEWILEHFRLEHGATVGVIAFGVGAALAAAVTARWVASNFTAEPAIVQTMPIFTAIVLGLQTVFHSFFLSMLAPETGSSVATDGG